MIELNDNTQKKKIIGTTLYENNVQIATGGKWITNSIFVIRVEGDVSSFKCWWCAYFNECLNVMTICFPLDAKEPTLEQIFNEVSRRTRSFDAKGNLPNESRRR